MAITQLHSILYTNQNMHIAASKQIDLQGRIDFQNIAAAAAANDKTREIAETRPTEEGKGIDPDREHNKERAEEEAGEKAEETKIKFKKKRPEDDMSTTHLLDIKA
ncbi:MAG TPA: hypothetical protein EYH01_01185 [Campylobacterales bacterium]|nr:hypothetical protein [Campylobacterales bacterium]